MKANIEMVGVTTVNKPLRGFYEYRAGNHFENGKTFYHYRIPRNRITEALEKGAREEQP